MNDKSCVIRKLEKFKELITSVENQDITPELRSAINKDIHNIREILIETDTFEKYYVTPPPMIGGQRIHIDPLSIIFDPPWRMNIVPKIRDTIDQAIGVIETKIETKEDLFTENKINKKAISEKPTKPNKIFIVHGKDNELKQSPARFLENQNLNLIILHEQTNDGKTIIEKFENNSNVEFSIVLITPDDLIKDKYRARQNVIFELGYFIGKLGRGNVVSIVKEEEKEIEIPTDIHGLIHIKAKNNGWLFNLAKEMEAAGFNIDFRKIDIDS